MEPHSTPPEWLETIGWTALVLSFASAAYILYDIYLNRHRQKMTIMEVVYPVTALYFGPGAVWFYHLYGRRTSTKTVNSMTTGSQPRDDSNSTRASSGHSERAGPSDRSNESDGPQVAWNQTAEAVTHCGAGCTLGDIIAEWSLLALGIVIAGHALYADILFDFLMAWLLGVIFQYLTIRPMRQISRRQAIKETIKVDTLSIIAFQIGLFAGMITYQLLIFPEPLPKTSAAYWFLMQLSMIIGFFTAYPVNRWLIRRGIKEAM